MATPQDWSERLSGVGFAAGTVFSIRARMSATDQAVVLGPSLIAAGNRPDATPDHHVDLLTGISAGIFSFLLPIICGNLKNPCSGSWFISHHLGVLCPFQDDTVMLATRFYLAEDNIWANN